MGEFDDVYRGTVGKTFGCRRMTFSKGQLMLILGHMMFQPYADLANGTFGDGKKTETGRFFAVLLVAIRGMRYIAN